MEESSRSSQIEGVFLSLSEREKKKMNNAQLVAAKTTMPISSRVFSTRSSIASFPPARRIRHHQRPAPRRRVAVRAEPQQPDTPPPYPTDDEVAAAFARFIAADPSLSPPPRSPSPLHSPTTVSRALCSALQRPDSPEKGSGARIAFDFTLPFDVAPAAPVLAGAGRKARSWHAKEAFLSFDSFLADSVSSPPADAFEDCESWELIGDLTFTGRGSLSGVGDCSKAAQAVSVTAAAERRRQNRNKRSETSEKNGGSEKNRKYTATILLTRVDEPGPWKGCWMVYGMRTGNYCSV
jgi:hypothetical protein